MRSRPKRSEVCNPGLHESTDHYHTNECIDARYQELVKERRRRRDEDRRRGRAVDTSSDDEDDDDEDRSPLAIEGPPDAKSAPKPSGEAGKPVV